ncbi:hypothetical protein VNO80_25705 [Phaseolus coccineus]|uniref:Uncharacterized protein n=1 Tax=Phaseolus coccineus TaxID=3886 RepID=A0AAN9LV99_PHACN
MASTEEESVRGDDPGRAVDRSAPPEQVGSPLKLDWVDPKVTQIIPAFRDAESVAKFLEVSNSEDIMTEFPSFGDMLDDFRIGALQRKGRSSIEIVPSNLAA